MSNFKSQVRLWLDDVREPWKHGCIGWVWVKTADEAIDAFSKYEVVEASLDHDLSWEHYPGADTEVKKDSEFKEKTGMAVIDWMEETGNWPKYGVMVHSMNPVGRQRMVEAVIRHYGGLPSNYVRLLV